jgi:hypothetical protein
MEGDLVAVVTTLGALVTAQPALASICQLRLSAKSAYHLKKLAQLVAQETKHFHEERDALIKELGTARPDGGFELKPDSDQFPVFVAKVNELAAVDVSLPWGPITLAMLGDEKVSAQELTALGPLVAEPEADV